jgi:DNA-binding NarL/FixJ family response regulator
MRKPLRVAILSRHVLTRAGLTQLIEHEPDRAVVVADGTWDPWTELDVAVYDLAGQAPAEDGQLLHLFQAGIPVVALHPGLRENIPEHVLGIGMADVVSIDVTADALLRHLEQAAASRWSRGLDGDRPGQHVERGIPS